MLVEASLSDLSLLSKCVHCEECLMDIDGKSLLTLRVCVCERACEGKAEALKRRCCGGALPQAL